MPTVLVVDDDPAVRTLIGALLQRIGMEHDHAGDGLEAMAKLRRKPYDALVLDLMLPEANGFDVIQFLDSHHGEMLGRTIVITAAAERVLERFDLLPVRAFLRKPFDIHELIEVVKDCVYDGSKSER